MLFTFFHPEQRTYKEHAVVVFVRRDSEVLLIVKKRGMGAGKINGPGGKLEKGESYRDAAIRETKEEVGLDISDLTHCASLGFTFEDGYSLYGQVFMTRNFTGSPIETEEAEPFWCGLASIPWNRMWEDDILWLPQALEGTYIEGKFHFDGDRLLAHQISVTPVL